MIEKATLEHFSKLCSLNGIDVFLINTDKFKTNTINIFFNDRIDRERAAKNALVPAVLRRGCKRLPTYRDLALYLEELYGAVFDCGVTKKGERQILQFYLEYASDQYVNEGAGLFEKAFDLLMEIITDPVVDQEGFRKDYLDQEKQNLANLISSRVNDKLQYALERCFEEMCKDEPFGVYDYGYVEDLETIDSKGLFEHYQSVIKSYPMQVFITGQPGEEKVRWMIEKLKQFKRGSIKTVDISSVDKEVKEVRHVTERMNINQGKLSIGFRTGIASNDERYYPLVVMNGILGGGVHSKLFQNVREKASLAYYVFSRLEKFKGLMLIGSGIDMGNRDKVVEIALAQLTEIKKGNISDYEFEATVKTIENGIRSLADSQIQMVDYYLSQVIVGTNDGFDTFLDKVKKVTREQVIEVAKNIRLDMVYFLTSTEEGE